MATIVISGGTDGMGRALAEARAAKGDRVVIIGTNPDKARRIRGVEFLRADLRLIEENRRVAESINEPVDALVLFANRQAPRRRETEDGLEETFALYYLSRYLLGRAIDTKLIVNVAGVGITKGTIHWDDLQLTRGYGMIKAQLQAARLNDLLGVMYDGPARYVLYHPGFTRSGDLSPLPFLLRTGIKVAAGVLAQPVERAVAPIQEWIDHPPAAALTAVDRGRAVRPDLPTLRPEDARRLKGITTRADLGRER